MYVSYTHIPCVYIQCVYMAQATMPIGLGKCHPKTQVSEPQIRHDGRLAPSRSAGFPGGMQHTPPMHAWGTQACPARVLAAPTAAQGVFSGLPYGCITQTHVDA